MVEARPVPFVAWFAPWALPALSIAAALQLNYTGDGNFRIAAFLVLAAAIPLILLSRIEFRAWRAMSVYAFSLGLLLQNALLTDYLWGWDIQIEHYVSSRVLESGLWDAGFAENVNSMLVIAILVPTAAMVSGLSPAEVLKYVFPLLFALVPVVLLLVLERQLPRATALASVFFFVSIFTFYGEMLQLARQQAAEFFVLLLCLLVVTRLESFRRRTLLLLLSFVGLLLSHYGLAYLWLGFVVAALVAVQVQRHIRQRALLRPGLVLLFAAGAILWYGLLGSGSPFLSLVFLGNRMQEDFTSRLFDPATAQGAYVLSIELSPLRQLTRYLHLASFGLVILGAIAVALRPTWFRLNHELRLLALVGGALVLSTAVVPDLAGALNVTRVYHTALLFAAGLFGVGASIGTSIILRRFNEPLEDLPTWALAVGSAFLALFFLMNSGVVYELAGEPPTGLATALHPEADFPFFSQEELRGAAWMKGASDNLRADEYRRLLLLAVDYPNVARETSPAHFGDYYFLGARNLVGQEARLETVPGPTGPGGIYAPLGDVVSSKHLIYASGRSAWLAADVRR